MQIDNIVCCNPMGAELSELPATDPLVPLSGKDLAYIIYTSGSTGRPKGVMISHDALSDHVFGMIEAASLRDCRSFSLIASLAADAGHSMLFAALELGACVHLMPEALILDGQAMNAYMTEEAIDCIKIVPSLWLAYADGGCPLLARRCLVFGGEAFQPRILSQLKALSYEGRIYNHYGPTEVTIGKLIHRIDPRRSYEQVPIGRPFSNATIYVADRHGEVCPPGVPGELLIGGDGLAEGYLHAPEQTAAAFVQQNFRGGARRFYRTGDLVAWNAHGEIEFKGRGDDQMKINGQRIEPGEIEAALMEDDSIRHAVVMPRRIGAELRLVAYIVPQTDLSREATLALLSTKLPAYMMPRAWVVLERLPVNAIGKLDRGALPMPEAEESEATAFVAPRNATETTLTAIWEEVLQRGPIGINDNFFDLGGHSLLMVRIISQVRRQLGVALPVTALFEHPTIERLSTCMAAMSALSAPGQPNEFVLEL